MILQYLVQPEEIRACDTSSVSVLVDKIVASYDPAEGLGRLLCGVSGYDDDTRALFEIPEVRTWAEKLFAECPFVFAVSYPATIQWLFPCICETRRRFKIFGMASYKFRREHYVRLKAEISTEANLLHVRLVDSESERSALADGFVSRFTEATHPFAP